MQRDAFLAHVGDPAETRARALELGKQSLALWQTIKNEFYTVAGKPRAKEASREARQTRLEIEEMRREEARLIAFAYDQERARNSPWSHIQPDQLERWGLSDVAQRVRDAHSRFIADAEAA